MKYVTALAALTLIVGCADTSTIVHSGVVSVWADPLNGCQYVMHGNGGITPRLDWEGKQICGGADTDG